MKKIIFLFLIVCSDLSGLKTLTGQYYPFERVYLQTDKQLYLAGELVYMKVLTVTPEKKPLQFSKTVYVELLDVENSRAQVIIGLTGGVGEGWLELPLSLSIGYYRLIAYTRFMRNETDSVFFEKNIAVVNTFQPGQIRTEPAPLIAGTHEQTASLLRTDKQQYRNREQGILKLEQLPKNIHTLSVSIAGKEPEYVQGNTINNWQPHSWGVPLRSPMPETVPYIPEYEGHIVTGKIIPVQTSLSGIDETLIPLLSFPGENLYLFEGKMNNDIVSFYTHHHSAIKEMATTALTESENKYRIDLQSPFAVQHAKKQLPVLKVDSAYLEALLDRSVALQALHSYTKDSLILFRSGDNRFDMKPTNIYLLDNYTRFVVMNELIVECVSQLRFRRNNMRKQELFLATRKGDEILWLRPFVVLDGIPILDHELIYRYDPLLVERINIYQGEYVYGGLMFDGIVEFLTYKRNYPSLTTDQSTQVTGYAGAQTPRQLYTPVYSNEKNLKSRLPDFRHTLLWEPAVKTNGKSSLEIKFFTSDFKGEFLVTVEGVTADGKIIFDTATFEVK